MSLLKANTPSHVNAPSPTPSNSSATGAKRKRPVESNPVVYSQPIDEGTGDHVFTKFTYVQNWLRERKTEWVSFEAIMEYLGVKETNPHRAILKELFRAGRKGSTITWDSATDKYKYKPKHEIANTAQLKRHFQNQNNAKGLEIKNLKDNWDDVATEIKGMENKKEILVKRSKDGNPKVVWNNDPSLSYPMDPEFTNEWHKIAIPANPDDLRAALKSAGIKASTQAPKPVNTGAKQKKKKASRRTGKYTNTHMAGILKDFSHLQKK